MIAIIDYKAGNVGSIQNMLAKIGRNDVCITNSIEEINKASKIILPGVGSFDYGMQKLNALGIIETLNHQALVAKIPVLGICLGAQLLTEKSEEGEPISGLGWIPGETVKFKKELFQDAQLKVPHMGWADLSYDEDSALLRRLHNARFYFVHSYHIVCYNEDNCVAKCNYGYSFPAIVQAENIWGCQFHPEKSHRFGMQLLENFSNL